ncbi:MAG: arsenic resistance protein [Pseudomonadota bacterium]
MTAQGSALTERGADVPAPFGTAALFVGAITAGAIVGLLVPSSDDTFSRGIDTTLLVMIFLLFFDLRFGAIISAFRNLRFLSLAWGANFLVIPILGFGIASVVFSGQPLLFAGLMIYFLAPCTDWFLGFTRIARGDTEMGAALIPVNLITQLLLFPFWLWLITQAVGSVDFAAMPSLLAQWFVVPLLAAQGLRFTMDRVLRPDIADRIVSATNRCVPFVLAVLIFQIFASHIGVISAQLNMFALVGVAVCLFFIATLAMGELLSRLGRLDRPKRALLSMTMAARNAPLMLALTAIAIPDQPLVLAVIVSAMLIEIPLLTALSQILLKRRPER